MNRANLTEQTSNGKPVDLKENQSSVNTAKPHLKLSDRKAKHRFIEPVALFVTSPQQEAL
ncbi:hypothetical protein [Acinetobacter radioresistens]|uniref:hypothetical protein n=1 Tax=Acinetobacter radioresistens TaxID=40216 RepID=UPI0011A4D737|nr:hypothetical protein [Acinetobacter radioresistens]MCK4113703.1 hypothetical protein [Acinetobacter radioresistens]